MKKINQLLKSNQPANNLLAFQFLQSQEAKSPEEALSYIFDYQLQNLCFPHKFSIGTIPFIQ